MSCLREVHLVKRIGTSDIVGERGIAHIRQVVLSMGYMFYETGGVEVESTVS